MKFGVREVADVMLKARVDGQKVGNKTFQKGQPVCHFDSLKTTTVEGAATTVYATGGKGNPRLIAWEGERTLTFTMEDALISTMGIAILTGAGIIEAGKDGVNQIPHHITATIKATTKGLEIENAAIDLESTKAWDEDGDEEGSAAPLENQDIWICGLDGEGNPDGDFFAGKYDSTSKAIVALDTTKAVTAEKFYMVDYYVMRNSSLQQIDIEPDKFGGNYYLEASTLFRDQSTGEDYPAEFILPNCRIQSNFTFAMAPTGDPSTFTFTVDAFPGVTKYDASKKVLCAIQVYSGE
jgi:hypothetical protein